MLDPASGIHFIPIAPRRIFATETPEQVIDIWGILRYFSQLSLSSLYIPSSGIQNCNIVSAFTS